MFNNKFNSTKKDPLVEAVQIAMQDGEIRRQAEALVNEEFGVFNRRAVVREQLSAYDARLEEAYKCMKEGEKKDEKKEDKPKADYSKMREKMVGKGKDLETTRKIVGEAKKLADKDYDKDGKVESPKDEVWGSRFRAAKMAGKMEEEEQIDEATGLKKVVHKLFGKQIAKHRANKADSEMERTLNTRGSEKKWAKNYDARERYGRIAAGKPPFKDMDEETQIDEISKKLALKAMKKSDERGEEEYDRDMTDDRLSDPKTHWDRAKRLRGHMKRKFGNKTIKTGGTDNLSPKSYEQGGGERRRADKLKKGPRAGMISARHRDKLKDNIKYSLGKHKKPNLPEETQMDEAAYSAKAARAGKDIGKPGKSFSKIAKSAAARYGSEERGKKVAGSILARIRAKHMKEEQIDEIVTQAQLKSSGLSLRDYMNKEKGLTRRDSSAPTAKTSTPQGAVGLKGPTGDAFSKTATQPGSQRWADPGKRDYSSSNQGTMKSPTPSTPTPAPEKTSWHAPMVRPPQELASKTADVNTGAPKVAQGAPMPTATAAAPKNKEAGALPKTMAESVQVGANKYRIV